MRRVWFFVIALMLLAAPRVLGPSVVLDIFTTAARPSASATPSGLIYDVDAGTPLVSDGTLWLPLEEPSTLSAVAVNAGITVATFGGEVLPAAPYELQAIRYRVSVAGAVGSTNATFRATDGSNNCDCSFACNASIGNYRTACTGSCVFPPSASLTYSFTSAGDCATPPTILGNLALEGRWR